MTERMEFEAAVEGARGGGALVRLPPEAATVFGTKGRVPVKATFNGIPYRGSTMPTGDGTSCLGIRKEIRNAAGLALGDTVRVTVERDETERTVDLPVELDEALRSDPVAAERFAAMSYSHRREYAEWVGGAKQPETRRRRVEQAVAMIARGKRRSSGA